MHHQINNMDTRTQILEKNFEAICKSGFQAVRTDKVVADLGITKGAFYHYFKDKYTLGYAIVDEIIYPAYTSCWQDALNSGTNSIESIIKSLRQIKAKSNAQNISLGCPLNNLIQEMSSIDEVFRQKLAMIIDKKLEILQKIIQNGVTKKEIHPHISPFDVACFIIASLEGSYTLGKSKNSLEAFEASMQCLISFLNNLKC